MGRKAKIISAEKFISIIVKNDVLDIKRGGKIWQI